MRENQRGRADIQRAAKNLADRKGRFVHRSGKHLFVDQMVLYVEMEHAQLLGARMATSRAQIGDDRMLVGDERAILDLAPHDMAGDQMDALDQIGDARIASDCGDRMAVGREDASKRAETVEQDVRNGDVVDAGDVAGQFFQESSAPWVATRREWSAVPTISAASWR